MSRLHRLPEFAQQSFAASDNAAGVAYGCRCRSTQANAASGRAELSSGVGQITGYVCEVARRRRDVTK